MPPPEDVLSEAYFLKTVAQSIFDLAKEEDGSLMEVQATLLDDTLYIASNYRAGNGLHKLSKYYPPFFEFWRKKQRVRFQKETIQTFQSTSHAEQALLGEFAKKLKNTPEKPIRMVVIGTKRPCSYCRRVLRAFNAALTAHRPDFKLHFVDRTGKTLPAAVDCLVLDPGGVEGPYKQFATKYKQEFDLLIPFQVAIKKIDDEALEDNSVRTNASAEISHMV